MERIAPPRRMLRVFVLAGVAIAGFTAFDLLLVEAEREERLVSARELFAKGQALEAAGKPQQALGFYRDALTQQRQNPDYQLAMVRGLVNVGRVRDAESAAAAMLNDYASSGPANLAMARILVREGRPGPAAWYYHRAIYGSWTKDQQASQTAARFELADMLARQGSKNDLVAEALQLEAEAPKDVPTLKRISRYYLQAESWTHADSLYRVLIREAPRDPEVWIGFGDVQFGLEHYARAGWAYGRAEAEGATDPRIKERIEQIRTGTVPAQPDTAPIAR